MRIMQRIITGALCTAAGGALLLHAGCAASWDARVSTGADAHFAMAELGAPGIPARPEDIQFPALTFEPPSAHDYRREIAGGVPIYIVPDNELPLVSVTFSFRAGESIEPASKAGLARMTGAMIRRGGTTSVSAADLDEEFDFLAANVSSFVGSTNSGATLNCLSTNFDDAFALFMDMVRNPGFQDDRVEIYRKEVIESMRQRNDDPAPISSREWAGLLYGWGHFEGRVTTIDTLSAITVGDLRAFHAQIFQPGNLIIGVSGDVDPDAIAAKLEAAISGWTRGARMPAPTPPDHVLTPGVYVAEKDIPQGRVIIGHRSVHRDHPDAVALTMMNDILGGSGFTSRITKRVRSDEGLAYTARSSMSMPPDYPGVFTAFFQSQSRTVALAARIVLEEIARIRNEPVTEEELETVKSSFIETFPRQFESRAAMVGRFIQDEWTGRDPSYYQTIRDRVRAVTVADVQRVAREHLHPEEVAILIVGKWADIAPGDLEGRASMSDFFEGQATMLPERDPLTMRPVQN